MKVRKLKMEIDAETAVCIRKLELEAQASQQKDQVVQEVSLGPAATTFKLSKRSLMPAFREAEVNSYFVALERIATALKWPHDVWPLLMQCW